ncbi:MAG: hypothetical protein AB7E55_31670 [Pigmentiphaga sp.]
MPRTSVVVVKRRWSAKFQVSRANKQDEWLFWQRQGIVPACEFEPAPREFDPCRQNRRQPPHREFRLHRLGRHRDKAANRATGQHHPRRYLRPSGGPRA